MSIGHYVNLQSGSIFGGKAPVMMRSWALKMSCTTCMGMFMLGCNRVAWTLKMLPVRKLKLPSSKMATSAHQVCQFEEESSTTPQVSIYQSGSLAPLYHIVPPHQGETLHHLLCSIVLILWLSLPSPERCPTTQNLLCHGFNFNFVQTEAHLHSCHFKPIKAKHLLS